MVHVVGFSGGRGASIAAAAPKCAINRPASATRPSDPSRPTLASICQVQYYDMPRAPGARVESPATLGRKCWAFAFLAQVITASRLPEASTWLGRRRRLRLFCRLRLCSTCSGPFFNPHRRALE